MERSEFLCVHLLSDPRRDSGSYRLPTYRDIVDTRLIHDGQQAIAPLLIILQVVSRSTSTGGVTPAVVGSIHFRTQRESAGVCGTLSDDNPMGSMGAHEGATGELGVGVGADVV